MLPHNDTLFRKRYIIMINKDHIIYQNMLLHYEINTFVSILNNNPNKT